MTLNELQEAIGGRDLDRERDRERKKRERKREFETETEREVETADYKNPEQRWVTHLVLNIFRNRLKIIFPNILNCYQTFQSIHLRCTSPLNISIKFIF